MTTHDQSADGNAASTHRDPASDTFDATTRSPSGVPEAAHEEVHIESVRILSASRPTELKPTAPRLANLGARGRNSSPPTIAPSTGEHPGSSIPLSSALPSSLMTTNEGRFVDQGIIAKGGMGSVHIAFDTVLMRKVAQKFLDQSQENDSGIVQQFIEEARITGQLDHPNVVPVHELAVGESGQLFFTMKYIDGETYGERIRRFHQTPHDPDELYRLLQVFLKVCDAVAFAHDRGVVHCDIKPDNVMVGAFGQVYVMDWGVALLRPTAPPTAPDNQTLNDPTANDAAANDAAANDATVNKPTAERAGGNNQPVQLGSSARNTQYVGGTLSYMAPEQAWGRPEDISPLTDVYGLGGLLHYLLTGKPPNYDTTRLDGIGNPRNIANESTLPLVPPGLCHIAERALSPRPAKRYPSVGELKDAVEAFVAGGGWFALAHFDAGATILEQGDAGDSAYVITEGYCDCWTEGLDGQPQSRTFIRTMGPGEVFGEMAVLTGRPRSATVTAQTAVKLRQITRESLEQELRRNPLLGSFVRTIASRFVDNESQRAQSQR